MTAAIRLLLSWPIFVVVVLLVFTLTGCQPMPEMVRPDPIVHTVIQKVDVPKPIPCFREDERPVAPTFPTPTPLPPNPSFKQKAAAEAADSTAMEVFARAMQEYGAAVDALYLRCVENTKRVLPPDLTRKP